MRIATSRGCGVPEHLWTRWAGLSRPPCKIFRVQRYGARGMSTTPPPSPPFPRSLLQTLTWEKVIKAGGAFALFGGAVMSAVQFRREVADPAKDAFIKMSFSLAKMKPTFSEDVGPSSDYVSRPSVEKIILGVYEKTSLESGTYFVMYGPEGAGKSSAVARVLSDKTGVAKIIISQGDTTSSILSKTCKMCGQMSIKSPRLDDFTAVLKEASTKRNGHPVTVVFEIDRGFSSSEILSLVKHVAKRFALNANVLIVLSEANAVVGFGDDQRQEFICVGEMSRAEAEAYVKKRIPDISSEDFTRFADNIGTLPLSLTLLCDALLAERKMDDHIRRLVALAKVDLVAFLHKPILVALKKSPGGVSVMSFGGKEHEGVQLSAPKEVAVAMKKRNAILYNLETQQYQPFSKAHQTALKTYTPHS